MAVSLGSYFAPRHLVLCGALVALAACTPKAEGVQLEPKDVIPAQADVVIGIELGAIIGSPIIAPFAAMATADPDLGPIVTAWKECELNTDKITVTVATTVASGAEDMLIFVDSPGIGSAQSMKCLEKEFADATGEAAGFVHFTERGKVLAAPDADGALTILANDHQIVHASANWQAEALKRANGDVERTPSAAAEAEARLGHPGDLYFAVIADDAVRSELRDVPNVDKLKDVSGSVKLSEGAAFEFNAHFSDEAVVPDLKSLIETGVTDSKADAVEAGVPQSLMDSFVVQADAGTLSIKFAVGESDLASLTTLLATM